MPNKSANVIMQNKHFNMFEGRGLKGGACVGEVCGINLLILRSGISIIAIGFAMNRSQFLWPTVAMFMLLISDSTGTHGVCGMRPERDSTDW